MDGVQGMGMRKVGSQSSLVEPEDYDLSRLLDKPRLKIEKKRSFDERSLSELSIGGNLRGVDFYDSMYSPAGGPRSGFNTPASSCRNSFEPHPIIGDAWQALRDSLVYFRGQPIGTIAAVDHQSEEVLNYDQVFVRDFVPSGLAFLMNGEPEIVKNFLLKTLHIQGWEKTIDRFELGAGVMPASFKVLHNAAKKTDTLIADFGESAIGRVAPVDSGFWWIILLRAYTKSTGDTSLADSPECQKGMHLILSLCLSEGFDTFPTLLCADGCSMIDRRMGIYGYPIEIQALFFMALRSALPMLSHDGEGKEFVEKIVKRLHALSYHMRNYFWIDFQQLNDIYRYKTEEYSHTAVNKFNVIPDSIPDWVFDFMPCRGGYFIGNVSPARMDFRWFCLGNCVAILSSLATPEQSMAIMDLIEERWEELVGEMPLKICYPAIDNHEWRIVTGCDPHTIPHVNQKLRLYHLPNFLLQVHQWPSLVFQPIKKCGNESLEMRHCSSSGNSQGSVDMGDTMEQPSSNSTTRIRSLQQCASVITELVNEKVVSGHLVEAFSVQLVILAIWKQALHICHAQAASAIEGRPSQDIQLLRSVDKKKCFESQECVSITDSQQLDSSQIEKAFLEEVENAEVLTSDLGPLDDAAEMPDAMEIIFQAALSYGRNGAVDELMDDIDRAAILYAKAVRLLYFLLVEAPSLIVNPPFSLTNSDRLRLRSYIEILSSRQSQYRSQRMALLKGDNNQQSLDD